MPYPTSADLADDGQTHTAGTRSPREAYDLEATEAFRRHGGGIARHLFGPALRLWRFSSFSVHERAGLDRLDLHFDFDDAWCLPRALTAAKEFAARVPGRWQVSLARRDGRRVVRVRLRWWNTAAARAEAMRLVLLISTVQ